LRDRTSLKLSAANNSQAQHDFQTLAAGALCLRSSSLSLALINQALVSAVTCSVAGATTISEYHVLEFLALVVHGHIAFHLTTRK
jgi:hypothetical protein